MVRHLPPRVHEGYVHAVAAALHPVFVVAALISVFAFLLTLMLREVPLRDTTRPVESQELSPAVSAERATVTQTRRA